jgi:hypothetical protein
MMRQKLAQALRALAARVEPPVKRAGRWHIECDDGSVLFVVDPTGTDRANIRPALNEDGGDPPDFAQPIIDTLDEALRGIR